MGGVSACSDWKCLTLDNFAFFSKVPLRLADQQSSLTLERWIEVRSRVLVKGSGLRSQIYRLSPALRSHFSPVCRLKATALVSRCKLLCLGKLGRKNPFFKTSVLHEQQWLCVPADVLITSSIRHLFGLGGWVGGSESILSLFGFSEMSDNCRPPLKNYKVFQV